MARNSPEKVIQVAILDAWGNHPRLRLWRANVGVGWYHAGEPARKTDPGAYPVKFGIAGQWDVSGIVGPDGRRLEIETKAPGKKLTPEQERWGEMIRKFGGLTIAAWDLEDVDLAFALIGITR